MTSPELRIVFPITLVSDDARIDQKSSPQRLLYVPRFLTRGFSTMLERSLKVLKGQPWVRAIKAGGPDLSEGLSGLHKRHACNSNPEV
jgi:hypothetical protein